MKFVNSDNNQLIQPKIASKEGVRCPQSGGNPYGATMDSLAADANAGLAKFRASPNTHYNNCPQKGGNLGHNYDADFGGVSYGYTKSGAAIAGDLKGSYAPITKARSTNMCGGRKRRRKSRKARRKSRKARRKSRKARRKSRKSRRKSGGKRHMRKHSRKSRKARRSRKSQKGGRYQQFGSNVPNTPSYSSPVTSGSMPWATGPVGIARHLRC